MSHTYQHNGFELPSVTTVIGDANPPGGLMQYAANKAVEWIESNCDQDMGGYYDVDADQLDEARYAHKEYSQEAMDTGSAVHAFAERFLNERTRI